MKNIKICTIAANFTHATIVVNNFIEKEYKEAKVIYIDEKNNEKKLESIKDLYFSKNIKYTEWQNEYFLYTLNRENVVFVVYGSDSFIFKVNKFIDFALKNAVVINAFEISDLKTDFNEIIKRHNFYLNTNGMQIKNKI